jgi:hypothetical protein
MTLIELPGNLLSHTATTKDYFRHWRRCLRLLPENPPVKRPPSRGFIGTTSFAPPGMVPLR